MAQDTTNARAKKPSGKGAGRKGNGGKKSGPRKAESASDRQQVHTKRRGEKRAQAYRRLAQRYAEEAAVTLPTVLTGQARREHVRATILEDHAERLEAHAQGTDLKFKELAKDLYKYFRGTALVFYRDIAGTDAALPKVLLLGDVHPGNFGVMPNRDNVPIFSVNDFDEVTYGPFTWDLKRGATGFVLGAKCEGGLKKKKRRKVAACFLQGYIRGLRHFAEHETETHEVIRMDNAPPIIARLFEEAASSRDAWLREKHHDEQRKGFRASDEIEPVSSRRDEFQQHVERLAETNAICKGGRCGDLKVKDVAVRHGAGTASLGLARFYVMLEGPNGDGCDDIIVEFKRARSSALDGIVPTGDLDPGKLADRIAKGQRVHLPNGDAFYGAIEIEGKSFLTRERAPYREDMDLDDLDYDAWREYADACGFSLALAHARSDDAGAIDHDVEPAILKAMEPHDLFVDDVVCFAEEAARRIKKDWKAYKRDWKLGGLSRKALEL
ncbi:DUF2252 domain-containing protein [Novosphingobium malaysiense]|uniref:DUF2252 domain-containing protein n=1 Tax=Novosphingobium malaysiense TaxID=1348853 RepID=A0A0B1ZMT4_9SPHN|nr:DUF2252 family protein [Novosphingobium malaysiense]KHK92455.1 hypothetical protein LK12_06530 [Novosphingobium malaysiense]